MVGMSMIEKLLTHGDWEAAETAISQAHQNEISSERFGEAGLSLLHIAANMGAPAKLIRLLVKRGIDPNIESVKGHTPAHSAILGEAEPETLEALLECGSKADNQTVDDLTPLHYAVASKFADTIEWVKMLIEFGADVNIQDCDGWTPLHFAMDSGAPVQVIDLLVKHGADPTKRNNSEETPLDLAQGKQEMVDALASGADRSMSQVTTQMDDFDREEEEAPSSPPDATTQSHVTANVISPAGLPFSMLTSLAVSAGKMVPTPSTIDSASTKDMMVVAEEEIDPAEVIEEEGKRLLERAQLIRKYKNVELPAAQEQLEDGVTRAKRLRMELDEVESRNLELKETIFSLETNIDELSKRDNANKQNTSRSTCVIS